MNVLRDIYEPKDWYMARHLYAKEPRELGPAALQMPPPVVSTNPYLRIGVIGHQLRPALAPVFRPPNPTFQQYPTRPVVSTEQRK